MKVRLRSTTRVESKMKKLTGITTGPVDDIPTSTLEKYAERSLREGVFDAGKFYRLLWTGKMHDDPNYVPPPPPPWRVLAYRAVRYWLRDHVPTVHLGPCDHEGCY